MKSLVALSLISASILVSACSSSTPACSDTSSVELVKEIADRELANQIGAEVAALYTFTVGAIRTTDTNEKTGAHECAAELGIVGNGPLAKTLPIVYTVEKTDNNKEIYVNVFGL